jgi:glycosyltransferase involved in cell wall biosynthesis
LKILHIVTYISPDGAYGGPVRVAINQAKALRDLGHDVVVAAAAGGFSECLPTVYDGFRVHLFPSRRVVPRAGFAGLSSPRLLSWLLIAIRGADVVHVHLARDLVSLPAAAIALLMKKPLVVQTHGMIDETDKWLAKPLDMVLTRPVLRHARSCLYLTEEEREDLKVVARKQLPLQNVVNGVALAHQTDLPNSRPEGHRARILFLARVHEIKRPLVFVEAARLLLASGCDADFYIAGPDEGELAKVQNAINASNLDLKVFYEGPVSPENAASRLSKCDVYVLPSLDETFPMSVIEALSVGRPVVLSSTCGLAPSIRDSRAGLVVDGSPESFADAIRTLLNDSELRRSLGYNGQHLAKTEFSISAVASRLVHIYNSSR